MTRGDLFFALAMSTTPIFISGGPGPTGVTGTGAWVPAVSLEAISTFSSGHGATNAPRTSTYGLMFPRRNAYIDVLQCVVRR